MSDRTEMVAKRLMSEQGKANLNPCIRFDDTIRCCKIGGLGSPLSGFCDRRTVEHGGERAPYQFSGIISCEIDTYEIWEYPISKSIMITAEYLLSSMTGNIHTTSRTRPSGS